MDVIVAEDELDGDGDEPGLGVTWKKVLFDAPPFTRPGLRGALTPTPWKPVMRLWIWRPTKAVPRRPTWASFLMERVDMFELWEKAEVGEKGPLFPCCGTESSV